MDNIFDTGVQHIGVLRHSLAGGVDMTLDETGFKMAESLGKKIIDRIPVESRRMPIQTLLVTSSLPRSTQSAIVFVRELKVEAVRFDFLRPQVILSRKIVEFIYGEITPLTLNLIVVAHNPQVDKLPHLFTPNLPNPIPEKDREGEGMKNGDGYFFSRATGLWEHLTADVPTETLA